MLSNADLQQKLKDAPKTSGNMLALAIDVARSLNIYTSSIAWVNRSAVLIGAEGVKKNLWILSFDSNLTLLDAFEGEKVNAGDGAVKCCPMNRHNAAALRAQFEYTKPVLVSVLPMPDIFVLWREAASFLCLHNSQFASLSVHGVRRRM
jgi:hypothetical protein